MSEGSYYKLKCDYYDEFDDVTLPKGTVVCLKKNLAIKWEMTDERIEGSFYIHPDKLEPAEEGTYQCRCHDCVVWGEHDHKYVSKTPASKEEYLKVLKFGEWLYDLGHKD